MAEPAPTDPTPDPAGDPRGGRWPVCWAVALAASLVLFGVAVKLYTGHVWEDFLITYRFSENLVDGRGLVYQPGERVFGFTSPLNAVLPALFKAVLGGTGYQGPLWAFALVSLAALGGGVLAFVSLLKGEPMGRARAQAVVFSLLCALQIKLVANATNGQEAGLWAGFLLMALWAILRRDGGWRALGLAAAGLLWTRPDSIVQIFVLGLGALAFADGPRAALTGRIWRAALLCALIYLPWFAWAAWYYGSPVPHTITAKMHMFDELPGAGRRVLSFIGFLPQTIGQGFEPIYSTAGGWPAWVRWLGLAAGTFCSVYWLVPGRDRIGRVASFVYLGSAAYLAWVGALSMIFPWYYVPCCAMGAVVLARVIGRSLGPDRARWPRRTAAWAALCALVLGLGYETLYSMPQLRLRQQLVEDGTRRGVGLWLRDHVRPGDSVFLEPIGYIGYYSRAHILDFPGLVAPEVVRARTETRQGFFGCIGLLRPDWLVLRPNELVELKKLPEIQARYAYAATFDAGPALEPYRSLPGFRFLESDSHLIILRRLPGAPADK